MDPEIDEFENLVRLAQSGNRQTQGDLLLRFQDVVMGVGLRRLGNFAEAQELCQEVFVQALLKLHQLREAACFGSWIRSIDRAAHGDQSRTAAVNVRRRRSAGDGSFVH
ncbi:MAG: sigma factor [Planctomycetota bacterium]|nr:sigma factor [Planctomycetota bacterium]